MPEFVLNRNYTHRSLLGHIINFKKGEPTFVPPLLVREVTGIGAEQVDGTKVDLLDEEVHEAVPLDLMERKEALIAAFELLEQRNARGDFTGQNRPANKALREICGFEVANAERDEVWQEYIETKADEK